MKVLYLDTISDVEETTEAVQKHFSDTEAKTIKVNIMKRAIELRNAKTRHSATSAPQRKVSPEQTINQGR